MKDISLHILDIAQNSIKADAKEIIIQLEACNDVLTLIISDDGKGMDEETLTKTLDPFYTTRTTRRVGMGIPMLSEAARISGGSFKICSSIGKGTVIEAGFIIDNIDRQPLGNIGETATGLILSDSNINYIISMSSRKNKFSFSTEEIKNQLGHVPITDYEVLEWIEKYLNDGVVTVFGGVLDEINS